MRSFNAACGVVRYIKESVLFPLLITSGVLALGCQQIVLHDHLIEDDMVKSGRG